MSKKKSLPLIFQTAEEMDEYLENNDLGEYFREYGVPHKAEIRKVNLDLPTWLVEELDKEAKRAGVSRQPLMKLWLVQKLEEERRKRRS